jgi:hypothetical protein
MLSQQQPIGLLHQNFPFLVFKLKININNKIVGHHNPIKIALSGWSKNTK